MNEKQMKRGDHDYDDIVKDRERKRVRKRLRRKSSIKRVLPILYLSK